LLLGALPAQAELTPDQAQCVNRMNKQLIKVDKEVSKQISSCIKKHAKGRPLGYGYPSIETVEACIQDDPYGKIQRAKAQTERVFKKYCQGAPTGYLEDGFPYFGATDADTVNMAGMEKSQNLVHDIFGPNLDSVLETKRNNWRGATCQQLVWNVVSYCEQDELKDFQQCKKRGLKGRTPPGLIQDGQQLQDKCLPLERQASSRGWKKINGAQCTKLLRPSIKWLCRGQDLPKLFPGCQEDRPYKTAKCLEDKVECRVCIAANKPDGLSQNCDLFDDGQANNSCGAPVSTCGDGTQDSNESCDDGNTDPDDGCSATCEIEECGDGIIQANEVCDDGGTDAGDGCSDTCQVEDGFECNGQPSTCGDIDECAAGTDTCDANATCTDTEGSFTCQCLSGFDGDGETCVDIDECAENTDTCHANATCTNTEGLFTCECAPNYVGDGQTCALGICGDGILETGLGEECDDGNTVAGDGCSAICTVEECGNGTLDSGETCDDGNTAPGDGCDESCMTETVGNCFDLDNDGVTTCGPDGMLATTADNDCDDTRSYINPGATEVCDGWDNNCTGDSSITTNPMELDADGDGYIECGGFINNGNILSGGGDCNDGHPLVFPGAVLPESPGSTTLVAACVDHDSDGWCVGGGLDHSGDGDCQDSPLSGVLAEDLDSAETNGETNWGDCDETLATNETYVNGIDDNLDGTVDEGCFGVAGGELIISEIFSEDTDGDDNRDWFEIYNLAWHPVWMDGIQVDDNGGTCDNDCFTVPGAGGGLGTYRVDRREFQVISERNQGQHDLPVPTLYQWTGGASFSMGDIGSADSLTLQLGASGSIIDTVDYSAFGNPATNTSYEFSQGNLNSLPGVGATFPVQQNDADGNWCDSTETSVWSGTNSGTASPFTTNTCP